MSRSQKPRTARRIHKQSEPV